MIRLTPPRGWLEPSAGLCNAATLAYSISNILQINSRAIMDEDGRMHFGVGDVHVEKNGVANIGIFGKSSSELICSLPVARQATYDASSQQDDEKCLEGTRTEVLQDMMAFARGGGEQHIFWLNGMAGSGKSTIARTLAEELHKEGLLGASFFFRRGFGDVAHAGKLFTTIAWQLTWLSSELEKLVCESIRKNPDISEKARKEQWSILIRQPLSEMRQTSPSGILVIIIDALDECDSDNDMKSIVGLLAEAEGISPIKIRIVVTSRPEASMRLGFRKMRAVLHRDLILDHRPSEEVNADIRRFYHHQFREIKHSQELHSDDWPTIEDIDRLVESANGLFIFAATLCRFIAENEEPAEDCLSRVLSSVRGRSKLSQAKDVDGDEAAFRNLDGMYIEILARSLRGREKITEGLRKTLGAIAVLQGPLSAVSLGKLMGDKTRPEVIYHQLDRLHSVLRVSRQPNSPIRVLHDSFREFLVDGRRCTLPELRVDKGLSHLHIFQKCLQTMGAALRHDVCDLQHPGKMVDDLDQEKVEEYLSPHVQYACRYWVNHLQHCTSLAEGVMSILAAEAYAFLKVHLLHWVEAMSLIGRFNEAIECVMQLELWSNECGEGEVSTTKVCLFYHIKVATPGPRKFEAYNYYRAKSVKLSRLSHTIADDF
jgi:hypothetical protein